MYANASELLSNLSDSFTSALDRMHADSKIDATAFQSEGDYATGEMAAASIALMGDGLSGTISIMADKHAFGAYVGAFSKGSVTPDIDDAVAISIFGEFSDALAEDAVRGLDEAGAPALRTTPSQILRGGKFKVTPPKKHGIKSTAFSYNVNEGKVYVTLAIHH